MSWIIIALCWTTVASFTWSYAPGIAKSATSWAILSIGMALFWELHDIKNRLR